MGRPAVECWSPLQVSFQFLFRVFLFLFSALFIFLLFIFVHLCICAFVHLLICSLCSFVVVVCAGASFDSPAGTATIGGKTCTPVSSWGHSQIICTLPFGQGTGQTVKITTKAGKTVSAALFNYDPPNIASINPTVGPTAGGSVLTLIGSKYKYKSVCLFVVY